MFPYPIEKQPILNQYRYRIFLYLSILTWLLPLIAIMLISVRSLSDLNAGNYWGVPSEIHFLQNYSEVFVRSPMARFFLNSLIITIPTTLITLLNMFKSLTTLNLLIVTQTGLRNGIRIQRQRSQRKGHQKSATFWND